MDNNTDKFGRPYPNFKEPKPTVTTDCVVLREI